MTKEEAIEELHKAVLNYDTEAAHENADDVLCRFLEGLGYHDLVRAYHKVEKWYA